MTHSSRKLKEGDIVRDKNKTGIFIKKYVKDGNRPYDTVHACKYCNRLCTHIQDHLNHKHSNESEVKEVIDLKINIDREKDQEQKQSMKQTMRILQDRLRYAGDNLHNMNVLKAEEGEFLISRKGVLTSFDVTEYGPCIECKLWLKLDSSLTTHTRKCMSLSEVPFDAGKKSNLVYLSRACIDPQVRKHKKLQKVISNMKNDEISRVAQGDEIGRASCRERV